MNIIKGLDRIILVLALISIVFGFVVGCHGLNIKTPFLIEVGFCVYDICTSIVGVDGLEIGKKAQVWKSTNFDAGLYNITGFS
ncbi:MAG: hypothetical protein LJE66_08180 [Desulfobacterales bacterium]|nr:hypothetical protein [Desulfobacterales bacterium]